MHESDKPPTALVVDNDMWERWLTSEILSDDGYVVLGASNGVSGLRLAENHPCDVILVDLALPELRGLEFLRCLKTMDSTRGVPVIVLGATPESQPCGAEGCVPRPLDGSRVKTEVGRCVLSNSPKRGSTTVNPEPPPHQFEHP